MNFVVADDETPICEWLVYCIKRISEDYRVHAASNGEEAYELILREKPDVVFTDIRMPGMDGLEMMSKVLAKLPYTVFAILTNHAEFSYAKQAVSLGAREYFLKLELRAADIERFIAAVAKQKKEIDAKKNAEGLFASGCIDLYSFFKNSDKPGFADSFWEKYGMAAHKPYVVLAVKATFDPEIWKLLAQTPQRALSRNDFYTAVSSIRGNHYIVLQAEDAERLYGAVEPLAKAVMEASGLTVGVSAPNKARGDFEAVARQAKCALDATFFGRDGLSSFEALSALKPLEREKLHGEKREILELLTQCRFDEATASLQAWFDALKLSGAEDVEWSIDQCRRMALAVEERGLQLSEPLSLGEGLQNTLDECKESCAFMIARLKNAHSGKCSAAVETALNYIHQNYSKPISMAEVARLTFRSPEYFSRRFKEETGQNFSVYLTLYRLNRAQELLRSTDLRISEVAEMVGYSTPGYFSRLYKKYKRIAPDREHRSKS